jgi:hypothetical protein
MIGLDDIPHTRVQGADEAPPGRPSRRRPLAVGAGAAVLAGVALVAAYTAGQGHGGGPAVPPAGIVPPAAVVPGGPGAARPGGLQLVAGVPVGYAHTDAGAVSAATNYAIAYGGPAMFVPAQRRAIVDVTTDPATRAAQQAQQSALYSATADKFGLDQQGRPTAPGVEFVARELPVGARLVAYTPDTAVVAVWEDGLVGLAGTGTTRPVQEGWGTTTVTLRWAAGDWKWTAGSFTPGPTPITGVQTPSDPQAIADAVDEFGGFSYVRL